MNETLSSRRQAGYLLILQAVLIAIPFAMMGGATGWPATTGDPGSKMLPLVLENLSSVRIGYAGYLLYSVLFFFTGAATLRALKPEADPVGTALAGLSALARSIGILRWLTAVPFLATAHAKAEPAQQAQLEAIFDAINSYGGGIGELLGVTLFASLWMFRVAAAAWSGKMVSKGMAGFTYFTAAFIAIPLVELFGVDLGPVLMATGSVLHIWFLAMGISLRRSVKS